MSRPVLLDTTIKTVTSECESGPRRHLIEVAFDGAPVAVQRISFSNYYCAAITVSHTAMSKSELLKGPDPASWKVVIPKLTLMADPHCEVSTPALSTLNSEQPHQAKHGPLLLSSVSFVLSSNEG
jgi:hypothetical protein